MAERYEEARRLSHEYVEALHSIGPGAGSQQSRIEE
jgi:hypothetical protein